MSSKFPPDAPLGKPATVGVEQAPKTPGTASAVSGLMTSAEDAAATRAGLQAASAAAPAGGTPGAAGMDETAAGFTELAKTAVPEVACALPARPPRDIMNRNSDVDKATRDKIDAMIQEVERAYRPSADGVYTAAQQDTLRTLTSKVYAELGKTIDAEDLQPCMTLAQDMVTGDITVALNNLAGLMPTKIAPPLEQSIEELRSYPGRPYAGTTKGAGSHCEVFAVNELLLRRPAAKLDQMAVMTIDTRVASAERGRFKVACPDCDEILSAQAARGAVPALPDQVKMKKNGKPEKGKDGQPKIKKGHPAWKARDAREGVVYVT